jgi:hypothetical protein
MANNQLFRARLPAETHKRTFRCPSQPPNFCHSFIGMDGRARQPIHCLDGLEGRMHEPAAREARVQRG